MSFWACSQAAVTARLLFFMVGMTCVPENRNTTARPSRVKYIPKPSCRRQAMTP